MMGALGNGRFVRPVCEEQPLFRVASIVCLPVKQIQRPPAHSFLPRHQRFPHHEAAAADPSQVSSPASDQPR